MVPNLGLFYLVIFQHHDHVKAIHTYLLLVSGTVLSCGARQWWQAIAPSEPHNHEDTQLIHLHIQYLMIILFFTFSTIFNY